MSASSFKRIMIRRWSVTPPPTLSRIDSLLSEHPTDFYHLTFKSSAPSSKQPAMEAFKSTVLGIVLRRVWRHPALLYNDEKAAPSEVTLSPTQSLCKEAGGRPLVEVTWSVHAAYQRHNS